GAAFKGADEDLVFREWDQDRQVGPGGEQLAPRGDLLPHRDQAGLHVLVDHRDQVGVRDGDGGEGQGGVEFGQADLDRGAAVFYHGVFRLEIDRGVLEPDLAYALGGGGAPPDGVVAGAAADLGHLDPAPVED